MFENLLLISCAYLTAGYIMHLFNKASKKFDAFMDEYKHLTEKYMEAENENS